MFVIPASPPPACFAAFLAQELSKDGVSLQELIYVIEAFAQVLIGF